MEGMTDGVAESLQEPSVSVVEERVAEAPQVVPAPAPAPEPQPVEQEKQENEKQTRTLRVAAVGCLHGELDAVYRTIVYADAQCGRRTDLVLICGDVQAARDAHDLASMSFATFEPRLSDFQAYHDGRKRAPILTLVVGGNHEASQHFWELYHGGWLAPNIFYLGTAAVVRCGGLRVAGVSGIAKAYDFARGYACPPPDPAVDPVYFDNWCHSVYHLREYEFFRLGTLASPWEAIASATSEAAATTTPARLDIVLSHDWPTGIARQGDTAALYRRKPAFRAEAATLGSPALRDLLARMQPRYWIAAHHHVRHAVLVRHPAGTETRFLALSKVLPGYDFLQLLEIPLPSDGSNNSTKGSNSEGLELAYDLEWLHSVHATASLFPVGDRQRFAFPPPGSPETRAFALKPGDVRVTDPAVLAGMLRIPPCATVPGCVVDPPALQQQRFLELLQTLFGPFPLHPPFPLPQRQFLQQPVPVFQPAVPNPEEIPIDCGDGDANSGNGRVEGHGDTKAGEPPGLLPAPDVSNAEEIPLDC